MRPTDVSSLRTQPPAERPYGVEAIMRDNSGNWYSLTQAHYLSPAAGTTARSEERRRRGVVSRMRCRSGAD